MDTTIFQTADLFRPESYKALKTYTMRPVLPYGARTTFQDGANVKVVGVEGTTTIWYSNGYIVQKNSKGEMTIFPPKPLISQFFSTKSSGVFCQFHKSGAVTCNMDNETFHWSEDLSGPITHGAIFFSHLCGGFPVFENECIGVCDL
jgi:hypothetical protein